MSGFSQQVFAELGAIVENEPCFHMLSAQTGLPVPFSCSFFKVRLQVLKFVL